MAPPHCTVEPFTKFVPVTVSVKAAPPAVALVGERAVMVGAGLLMVNATLPEVPPPGAGVVTDTLAVPAEAMSAALIAAVKDVALT